MLVVMAIDICVKIGRRMRVLRALGVSLAEFFQGI
jgi:hypothetical protein